RPAPKATRAARAVAPGAGASINDLQSRRKQPEKEGELRPSSSPPDRVCHCRTMLLIGTAHRLHVTRAITAIPSSGIPGPHRGPALLLRMVRPLCLSDPADDHVLVPFGSAAVHAPDHLERR